MIAAKKAVKILYRKYCYRALKEAERFGRTILFFLLNRCIPQFNSFRIFGLPRGWKTVESKKVIQAETIKYIPPNTLETLSHPHFEVLILEGGESRVATLPGGIHTAAAATITQHGYLARKFTQQFTMRSEHTHKLFTFRLNRCLKKIPHFNESVGCLAAECQRNYYHWLFDVLPKIDLMEKAGISVSRYYAETSLSFQRDSLKALGIDQNEIIPLQDNPVISADQLVTTTFPCQGGPFKWTLDFLRERFLQGDLSNKKRRLFISRRDATMRRIVNEEEFLPILQDNGFEIVIPGMLTFSEQVAIFRDAEVILSPHGAGLSNLVFAPLSAKIIEIYSPRSTCVCFWTLSNLLGMKYYYMRGIDDPSTYATTEAAHDHILVDPEKLKRTLELAL